MNEIEGEVIETISISNSSEIIIICIVVSHL
jgi:hypothetical protein